jgi:hypothetical protein
METIAALLDTLDRLEADLLEQRRLLTRLADDLQRAAAALPHVPWGP